MSARLDGIRVLVVEDRSAIAIALCDAVEDAGGVVVGPAARLNQTQRLIDEVEFDIGVLDVDLDGEPSLPAAATLVSRGVPIILLTGYGQEVRSPELTGVTVLEKPVLLPDLVERLAALAARRGRSGNGASAS